MRIVFKNKHRKIITKLEGKELGMSDAERTSINKALDVLYDEHYYSIHQIKRKYSTIENYVKYLAFARKIIMKKNIDVEFKEV